MRKSLLLKSVLLGLGVVSLTGCNRFYWVPERPELHQCVFRVNERAWYCVNNKNGARVKLDAFDYRMNNAQALSARDYKKAHEWEAEVERRAGDHCE